MVADENKQGVYVRINSDGLRDREHSIAKKPGALRIAVLGDSFAEAIEVPLEKPFWAVLERQLANCPIPGVQELEVVNFGVGGYGAAQELLTVRHKIWKYSPDVVLLAFFTGNDVRDNSRALNRLPQSPYFVYHGGHLVLDDSFRNLIQDSRLRDLATTLSSHSRLIQVVYGLYQRRKRNAEARQAGMEPGIDDNVYLPPRDSVWKEAWHVTEGLIHQLNQEVRDQGAQFWIATLSNGIQVNPDIRKREAFRMRLGAETLFYPDLRVKELAEREHIPVITLAIPFAEYAEKHKIILHGFQGTLGGGHWNEDGHRLAGEMIADRMCGEMKAR